MNVIGQGLISCCMECEPKHILTWGSVPRCFGEIWQFESPLLPVQSVLSVNSVSIHKTEILNLNFVCKPTIGIPQLPCLLSLAKAVSLTIELVNLVSSDTVKSFNFAMCAFACKSFTIELVPCSDGWRRTWWQTLHRMPELPVPWIPQCKLNHNKSPCLQSFQAVARFKPTLIEAHHASKMICKERSFKSRIQPHSFLKIS